MSSDTRVMVITGRLGRDATVKYYDNDTKKLLELAVANTIGYGEKQDTMWFSVTSFRKNDISFAEGSGYKKGALVSVIGEYKIENFTKKDGTAGQKHVIMADRLIQLSFGDTQQQPAQPPVQQPVQQQNWGSPPPQNWGNQPPVQQQFGSQPPAQQQWGGNPPPQQQRAAQPPKAGGWGADDEDIPF